MEAVRDEDVDANLANYAGARDAIAQKRVDQKGYLASAHRIMKAKGIQVAKGHGVIFTRVPAVDEELKVSAYKEDSGGSTLPAGAHDPEDVAEDLHAMDDHDGEEPDEIGEEAEEN